MMKNGFYYDDAVNDKIADGCALFQMARNRVLRGKLDDKQ